MQVLLFHLARDRYGLDTRHIARVLPMLELKRLPGTPDFIAGLMNYQGISVPVIDLSLLAGGNASKVFFDTRIIVVNYPATTGSKHLLGLIAEQLSGIQQVPDASFSNTGVASVNAPFLGQVTPQVDGILQLIEIDQLLPESVRAILFRPEQQGVAC